MSTRPRAASLLREGGMEGVLAAIAARRHLLVPLLLLSLIAVLVIPLPPPLLDLLLAANISVAAVILLTTVHTRGPLDFSVFPALLLITTLARLVLNVASTRLILTADAPTPEAAVGMAGAVIEAFGTFVAGSSIVVGIIIFLILVVVQFVVVTKGATRMSEVAARFTLDAMPGRQMATDADLAAGLIDEAEATVRRDRVMREADFYGAMDGASKFVRGDAIAGLVIIAVNIVGGLAIGILSKGWSPAEAASLFTRLTIGDGLVSQIPAFLIAIAAGLMVARGGDRSPLGVEIPRQLVSHPVPLALVAGFLVVLSLTPLPTAPLLLMALLLGALAWRARSAVEDEDQVAADQRPAVVGDVPPRSALEPLQLELGLGLVRLVDDGHGGTLLERIAALRASVAQDLGFIVPSVRIRDSSAIAPTHYRIKVKGGIVGEGALHPDRRMVVIGETPPADLEGIDEREPAFGLKARWIELGDAEDARRMGLDTVDATSVLLTHLSEVVRRHADELLTREEVSRLVDQLREVAPRLVEEAIGQGVPLPRLHLVLRTLLSEGVAVLDMETILEAAADGAALSGDACAEHVRLALRRQICAAVSRDGEPGRQRIAALALPSAVEAAVAGSAVGAVTGRAIAGALASAATPLVDEGLPVVVVAAKGARRRIREAVAPFQPEVVVLGRDEIVPEVELQVIGTVKMPQEGA